MIKKTFTVFIAITFAIIFANGAFAKRVKNLTQLQRREIETHFYETADTQRVMKAAINTLQDSGYIVQEIEPELGYLRARKTYKKRFINKARLAGQSLVLAICTLDAISTYGSTAYHIVDPAMKISNEIHEKTVVIDTNVNVEQFGQNKTKVRIVFSQKVLLNADGYSYVKAAPTRVLKVFKPEIYQEFFAQLDKSLFYEGI